MIELLAPLLLIVLFFSILLYRFSKPLTDDQILRLSQKRRNKNINHYFANTNLSVFPSLSFKKSLKPDGRLYQINVNLPEISSFVANLLKYKKHEWSAIVFVENREAKYLWANKGPDRTEVTLVPLTYIVEIAKKYNCDVIMAFHNHPAHDPHNYSYRNPSKMDLQSAQKFSETLTPLNISYVDHVCERGLAYRYCLKPSDKLYPLKEISSRIVEENLQGNMEHIRLHFELYL